MKLLKWLPGIILMWIACDQPREVYSPLLDQVFLVDTATFRGINLGDELQEAKNREQPQDPSYEDPLGVVYEYSLEDNQELFVEYYLDNFNQEEQNNSIVSIIANISMQGEVEADALYKECMEYFTRRYGLSSGTFGNYTWEDRTQSGTRMEIILKLDGSKRGITINFIDKQVY